MESNYPEHIQTLLERYMEGTATEEEKASFLVFVQQHPETDWYVLVSPLFEKGESEEGFTPEKWESVLQAILHPVAPEENIAAPVIGLPTSDEPLSMHRPVIRRIWWVAAASVILLLSAGAFLWQYERHERMMAAKHLLIPDVAPGKQGAILTLGDGRQVLLDSMGDGIVSSQNGVEVVLANGKLAYRGEGNSDELVYNTMSTPRGRQFQLTLPDGTHVWLNAASSIRYPTVFKGSERVVEITGEAYFEVVHNSRQPFRVKAGNQLVEDIGTVFNVNAYHDENACRITLVEGKAKVEKTGTVQTIILQRAGQQAVASYRVQEGSIRLIEYVDIGKVIAWKNGVFNFEGIGLEEAMRQIARWYNIDVSYERGVPNVEFVGKLDKNVSLSTLLKALEGFGIKFRIEGNGHRLVVLS